MTNNANNGDIAETIGKILTLIFKIGIFIGGLCIVIYSYHIGYFPQGISTGDTISFLIVSGYFGLLYSIFVSSLIGLGITTSLITKPILKFVFRSNDSSQFALLPFSWWSLGFSVIAIIFIIILGYKDSIAFLSLPIIAITEYIFASIYVGASKAIEEIKFSESTHTVLRNHNSAKLSTLKNISLGVILFVPIFYSGVSTLILEGAMRGINVRIEKPIIYVKETYASLLPQELISKEHPTPAGYTAFDNTTVLLRGFGNKTVISYPSKKGNFNLEIPNEEIITISNLPTSLSSSSTPTPNKVATQSKEAATKSQS